MRSVFELERSRGGRRNLLPFRKVSFGEKEDLPVLLYAALQYSGAVIK